MGGRLAELVSALAARTVGLDLAASEERPSGWALLVGPEARTSLPRSDGEILELTLEAGPEIVAIDAPLSLPEEGYMREVDKLMHRLGLPVLPPLLPAMEGLTRRGIRIAGALREEGLEVIEVHPTSTRKVLGLPAKGRKAVQEALSGLGLRGDVEVRELTIHELDAVTAALTASLHLMGLSEVVKGRDGEIYLPRRDLNALGR